MYEVEYCTIRNIIEEVCEKKKLTWREGVEFFKDYDPRCEGHSISIDPDDFDLENLTEQQAFLIEFVKERE